MSKSKTFELDGQPHTARYSEGDKTLRVWAGVEQAEAVRELGDGGTISESMLVRVTFEATWDGERLTWTNGRAPSEVDAIVAWLKEASV